MSIFLCNSFFLIRNLVLKPFTNLLYVWSHLLNHFPLSQFTLRVIVSFGEVLHHFVHFNGLLSVLHSHCLACMCCVWTCIWLVRALTLYKQRRYNDVILPIWTVKAKFKWVRPEFLQFWWFQWLRNLPVLISFWISSLICLFCSSTKFSLTSSCGWMLKGGRLISLTFLLTTFWSLLRNSLFWGDRNWPED